MAIWDKLRNEFIDIIDWTDDSSDTIVYKFERYQNEIKYGAQLTVREGQVAALVNEGQLTDIFEPGLHKLITSNMPILTTLKGWKYGFDSPFKVDVYFINTKLFTDQKWGTPTPITLNDPRFGMFEIGAYGNYVFKVADPEKFLKDIFGTNSHFTTENIVGQLKGDVQRGFSDLIGESEIPVEKFAGNLDELSGIAHEKLKEDFDFYGIELVKFNIQSISMPDEIKKEIFELSRLGKIDMQSYTQYKTAKSIEKAAENPGGTAAAGVGMGMGFGMANQMAQGMNNANQNNSNNTQSTPPPLPQETQYYLAIEGKQEGPFNKSQLQGFISKGLLLPTTLTWTTGMENWEEASSIDEVNALFGSVPPPLPS
ncbi:MAG: SPFH domain-containing protein [Flavobacteriales bacterium]|nr:SPFH domain-containing protein [Flavobacteriales bacterium]